MLFTKAGTGTGILDLGEVGPGSVRDGCRATPMEGIGSWVLAYFRLFSLEQARVRSVARERSKRSSSVILFEMGLILSLSSSFECRYICMCS